MTAASSSPAPRPSASSSTAATVRAATHVLTALVLGVVGWLFFALSETAPARTAGLLLAAAGLANVVLAVPVARTGSRTAGLVGAGLAGLGAAAAAVALLVDGSSELADWLLLVLLPAALATVLAVMATRALTLHRR